MKKLTSSLLAVAALATLAGCANMAAAPAPAEAPARAEKAVAVTMSNRLIKFNAGQPGRILSSKAITGLQPGEQVLGIDYRVAKDMLYAIGSSGRLYTLDEDTAVAKPVGEPFAVRLEGTEIGFDFNPTVDRIRVVSNSGQNLRLHPDTGAVVDSNADTAGVQIDGKLAYAAGDAGAGKTPSVVGAAYSYNKANPRITTNYALDAASGTLVTQGSREGATPAVSPNTGSLFTVGSLRMPFRTAAFDIQAVSDVAFAALDNGTGSSRWVTIDLNTGMATSLGTVGGGEAVRAIALEP
ncbi:DUF4394 domain-containing protein [Caenimonas sedimenti]|uniref:DUF4394 domain-containing protein n=1 Tax=Caenimonas sedimenti TaxID=2596921 RepID=A0A562ZMD9_9BURK|nr:DUF4394 domain-containing protein [Caenimonas sedimenti]TWO69485.1 DUF4394 domain-containing protein [Caenimonas sedimenti]